MIDELGPQMEKLAQCAMEISFLVNALGDCANPVALEQMRAQGNGDLMRQDLLTHGASVLELMAELKMEPADSAEGRFQLQLVPRVLPGILEALQALDDGPASWAAFSALARQALTELGVPTSDGSGTQ